MLVKLEDFDLGEEGELLNFFLDTLGVFGGK